MGIEKYFSKKVYEDVINSFIDCVKGVVLLWSTDSRSILDPFLAGY